ncbi:hypothetical protein CPB83DRAFT_776395 [Crepidotus variabilis]|uniref:SET domain-containing protein n=1 Tax=Crepidotus variabilis TaxID=179855 RepID=A0A9P6E5K3_9AGAR|nr:hypothetical protein CPB83DRAFT_776395 [Crepidotus variabilis]
MDVSSNYTQLRASGHIAWSTSAPSLRTFYPAQPRTYIVRSLDLSQSGCVAMLDAGIDRLMPSRFNLLPTFKPSNITLQTSPGKGLGLFSPNMVYPGEALFAEHPILVLPYAVDAGVPLREAYDDMLSRLPAQTRQELLYFCQSTGAHEPTSAQHLISRITPFAIPLSVPNRDSSDVEMHRGVFLKMSRCNHSCGPNAVWRWDPESFSLILTAIRYINPGEEITIAYTNVSLPQHERRFNLRRSFGFRCACEWCTLDHKSVLESDAARFFLSTFWDSPSRPSFKAWCQESFYSSDTLILDHQRALRYIQREGLETLSSALPSTGIHMSDTIRHIDAISMCYAALEDIDKFAIWTRRAAEEREAFNVLGPDRKLVFSKWLSNPSCCPVWGAKKSTYLRG